MEILKVNNLSFSRNNVSILRDISFGVQRGEYVGLIGPNGAGKTTLLRIILGLLKPDCGTVEIEGVTVKDLLNQNKVGYVPQKVSAQTISFPATIKEIVESGRMPQKNIFYKFSKLDKQAVQKAMEIADVHSFQNKLIQDLSGGQRQRVFLARSLASEPEILILDEPTVGVDVASQDKFYEFLRHLNSIHKKTIILVSHDISVVSREVSRILCLNQTLYQADFSNKVLNNAILEKLYGPHFEMVKHNH